MTVNGRPYIVPRRFVRILHKHAPPPEVGGNAWLLRVKGHPGEFYVATHTLHAVDHKGEETAVFPCDKRGVPTSYEAIVGAENGGRTMTLMEAVCLLDDKFCYGRM
jgi:hypothetical protein